jgi:hypothetical protein
VARFLLENVPTGWLMVAAVLGATAVSLLGLVLVRRSVELSTLESHKEVAGFIIALVGVIYAVLIAFVVVITWEDYRAARNDANKEAAAVGVVYRDAVALGQPGAPLRDAVRRYAASVVNDEWSYMADHQAEDPRTDVRLNAAWAAVKNLRGLNSTYRAFVSEAVKNLTNVTEDRRTRILDSGAEVPVTLWVVLLVGAAITIGFTYFFGLEGLAAQALMISALASMIALPLVVILTLNLPFTGDVAVKPDAMRVELSVFSHINF